MEKTEYKPSVLDDILPEYEPISRAPSLAQLERTAEDRRVPFDVVLQEERGKRYKALHSQSSGIYLVQNPAAWLSEGKAVVMPVPKYVCSMRDRGMGEMSRKGRVNLGDLF